MIKQYENIFQINAPTTRVQTWLILKHFYKLSENHNLQNFPVGGGGGTGVIGSSRSTEFSGDFV